MKPIHHVVTAAAALAAFSLPIASIAQTAPSQAQGARVRHSHHGGMMRELKKLNLTADQQAKISALRAQYEQAHPKGSTPDPQAMKAMRDQVMSILSPAQQAQFKADMSANRAAGQNGASERGGMMRRFSALNLSDQQKSQIQSLMDKFHQAHPTGNPPDPQAIQALHSQINAILTPAQQQQLQAMPQDQDNGSNR